MRLEQTPTAKIKLIFFLTFFYFLTTEICLAQKKDAAVAGEEIAVGNETICEADVFFYWQQKPSITSEKPKNPTTTLPSDDKKVFFQTTGEIGSKEEEIKSKLSPKLVNTEKNALEYCKKIHENLGDCLAEKLSLKQDLLSKLDFNTKNTLINAATSDCQNQQGNCKKVESSEVRCYVNKASDPNPVPPAGGAKKK